MVALFGLGDENAGATDEVMVEICVSVERRRGLRNCRRTDNESGG
jgi:hypothetical protein